MGRWSAASRNRAYSVTGHPLPVGSWETEPRVQLQFWLVVSKGSSQWCRYGGAGGVWDAGVGVMLL